MSFFSKVRERSLNSLWVIALVCLPITSFPLFTRLSGAIVTPLSALPILLLMIFVIFSLKKGFSLPIETRFLILFIIALSISSLRSFFLGIFPTAEKSITDQFLRAYITLMIGAAFYIVFAFWPTRHSTVQKSLHWITIGGIISLLWSGLQAYFLIIHAQPLPAWMEKTQSFFVFQAPFFYTRGQRVAGLTYEASWYAHEMVLLYIPIWLAATIEKTSSFRFHIGKVSVENICLLLGIGMFYLSSPRISLLSIVLIVTYLVIRTFYRFTSKFIKKFFHDPDNISTKISLTKIGLILIVLLISFIIFASLFSSVLYLASQRDWRLALIFNNTFNTTTLSNILLFDQDTILSLGHRLAFLERTVYWFTGWRIFNEYPLLGVGLGNAGFFFPDKMPFQGWASYEVRVLLSSGKLPNIKSMWFRLLAESGLFGFSIFLTWLYILWKSAVTSHQSTNKTFRWVGLAGQLFLIAWIPEGLSIDSFGMPYFWIMAGLLSASRFLDTKTLQKPKRSAQKADL